MRRVKFGREASNKFIAKPCGAIATKFYVFKARFRRVKFEPKFVNLTLNLNVKFQGEVFLS